MARPVVAAYRRVLRAADEGGGGSTALLGRLVSSAPQLEEMVTRYLELYRGRRTVADRAISVIGTRVVRHLTVQRMVADVIEGAHLPERVASVVWLDMCRTASAARVLGERVRMDTDYAASSAMIQFAGLARALETSGQYLTWLRTVRPLVGSEREEAEVALFGASAIDMALEVGKKLELPAEALDAVRDSCSQGFEEEFDLPRVLAYASEFADWCSADDPKVGLQRWMEGAASSLGWSSRGVLLAGEQIDEGRTTIAELLGVQPAGTRSLTELLAFGGPDVGGWEMEDEASRNLLSQLEDHGLALEGRVRSLSGQVDDLARRDAVTRCQTHQGLRSTVADMAARASADEDMWLLHTDMDRFTEVNAAHGFEAGDKALERVARILERMAPPGAAVARVGADAFVVAMVANERAVRLMAERVRAGIEASRFESKAGRLRMTASIFAGSYRGARAEDPDGFLAEIARFSRDRGRSARNSVTWMV
jgi:diguanylate cyclase (GGDEF)-like protein